MPQSVLLLPLQLVCIANECICVFPMLHYLHLIPMHAGEGEDKYLIATSEQTLCAMHRKGWFERQELPRK